MSDVIEETPADDNSAEEAANEAAPVADAVAATVDTPALDEDALIYEKASTKRAKSSSLPRSLALMTAQASGMSYIPSRVTRRRLNRTSKLVPPA